MRDKDDITGSDYRTPAIYFTSTGVWIHDEVHADPWEWFGSPRALLSILEYAGVAITLQNVRMYVCELPPWAWETRG